MKANLPHSLKPPLKIIAGCIILLFTAGILLQSCIKKEDFDFDKLAAFQYEPNGAVPLIHSTLTLRDIINDYDTTHLFVEDATHFLYLIYKSTVFSQRADQLISIADQNVNSNFGFSTGAIANGDSAIFSHTTNYSFTSSSSERYDSMRLKSGNINFAINGDINHSARIYVTIPGAVKNGQIFKKTIYYNYTGSTPVNINDTFNLNGYTINFNAGGNQLTVNYDVAVYGDGNANASPYTINMGESFLSLKYERVFGYLGQHAFLINKDSVMIDIFKNNIHGSLYFEDPKLNIYANNAYGMPISLTFDLLQAISTINPPYSLAVNGAGLPSPWSIAAPTFAQFGQSVQTAIHLDQTNSNVKPAFNMSPRFVTYHVAGLSNPLGNPVTDQNFVMDSSRFGVDVEVELPMYGSAWDFRLQDTLDFSFGSDIDKLEWVLFKINTMNGFPVDATMQIYFADSVYNVKDSLLLPLDQVIASGVVGSPPDYKVIAPTHKYVSSLMDKSRLAHLNDVSKLLVYCKLATVNNGNDIVKFYSDYNVDVKVGVQAQAKYQVKP
jgi:hypothetical protein